MRTNEETINETAIEPTRLLAAADAILRASASGGAVVMWRDEQRPARKGFSADELVEALVFLRKVGLLHPQADESAG